MPNLIINADDCGYFPWVTKGIVDTARAGVVTATGVLANSADFAATAAALHELPELDVGVHLTATWGLPLEEWPAEFLTADGCLPTASTLFRALLRGALQPRDIAREWRAQLRRCLSFGLQPRFLNSHQHVHMWPSLARVARALADEFGIAHVRHVSGTLSLAGGSAGLARVLVLRAIARRGQEHSRTPRLLGLAESGKLTLPALLRLVRTLERNATYELMCHPGRPPIDAISPSLTRYHDWDGERRALLDAKLNVALRDMAVRLIRYRDLR